MAIFNSYVSLPEGTPPLGTIFFKIEMIGEMVYAPGCHMMPHQCSAVFVWGMKPKDSRFCDLEPSRHSTIQGLKQRISALQESLQPQKPQDTSLNSSDELIISHDSRGFNGESEKIFHSVGHVSTHGNHSFLVGGWPTPLKNMLVSWDDDIPNIWKVIKFHGSKPPTRYIQ